MVSSRISSPLLLLAVALIAWPFAARGDDEPRARAKALIAEAGRLYDEGDHGGALDRLQAAYAVYPSPAIHFNLGVALRALKRDAEAFDAFERFLAESPADDASLAARREEARGYLLELEKQVGAIELAADVVGADVTLDRQPVGRTPLPRPLRVAPGSHRLVVATALAREELPVEVRAGERLRVMVRMAAPARQPAPAVSLTAPPVPITEPPPPLYRRWWVWTAAAAVVAGAVTAVVVASRDGETFCDCNGGIVRFR